MSTPLASVPCEQWTRQPIKVGGSLSWPDGGRSNPIPGLFYTQALVPLTNNEIAEYRRCNSGALPIVTPGAGGGFSLDVIAAWVAANPAIALAAGVGVLVLIARRGNR